MHFEFEIRALIPVVGGKRWEKVATYPDYAERTARDRFGEMVAEHPFYFELLKVGHA